MSDWISYKGLEIPETTPSGAAGIRLSDNFKTLRDVATCPRGYIDGLTLANNSGDSEHDIDIAAGMCRDSGNNFDLILTSVMTKRIDASWTAGSGNGGYLPGGSVGGNTWYHVFLMLKENTDGSLTIDAGFDSSLTPTLPTGYSAYRRVGSVRTDGSANILAFKQSGDVFLWSTPRQDVVASTNASPVNVTVSVPTGVSCRYFAQAAQNTSSGGLGRSKSPDQVSFAATGGVCQNYGGGFQTSRFPVSEQTNTSSQITMYCAGASNWWLDGMGYADPRGKDI